MKRVVVVSLMVVFAAAVMAGGWYKRNGYGEQLTVTSAVAQTDLGTNWVY